MKTLETRARAARTGRRGASLVLFALLVFALLAVAALSVDVGLAMLTQAQMQDAVDSAALEGQRWRQYTEPDLVPTVGNALRRAKASEMVRIVFDDDLDASSEDERWGAGPVLEHAPGAGGVGGTLLPAEPVFWSPAPEINSAQAPGGDFVSGTFHEGAFPTEGADYARADFTPADGGSEPSWLGDAFLSRLRRTSTPSPEDDAPGAASHGPGVPLIFGHGLPIAQGGGATWDPRRDGITVRATAIAYARPALSVGATPHDTAGELIPQETSNWDVTSVPYEILDFYDHLGAAPFVITLAMWERYTLADPACVVVRVEDDELGRPTAVLRVWDSEVQTAGEIVGWFAEDVRQLGREALRTPAEGSVLMLPPRIDGYIPVVARIDTPDGSPPPWRVIGFGVGVLWDPLLADDEGRCRSDTPAHVLRTLSKFKSRVPATGVHSGFVEIADSLAPEEWSQIFAMNRERFTTAILSSSILAPALVR